MCSNVSSTGTSIVFEIDRLKEDAPAFGGYRGRREDAAREGSRHLSYDAYRVCQCSMLHMEVMVGARIATDTKSPRVTFSASHGDPILSDAHGETTRAIASLMSTMKADVKSDKSCVGDS